MSKIDQSVIDFAVYEDSVEFMGITRATLPDLTALTQTISGAGIAGNIESVIVGHFEAMTLELSFRNVTNHAIKLAEPRRHTIDLREVLQTEDTVSGAIETGRQKHIFVVNPKKFAPGSVAPASPNDASGEYAVRYWATYIDGVKVMEIDPINYKCFINGVDYCAGIRAGLGK
ncbi:MAG: phage major tail tube protein [Papillibacter sp.]|nr:phage major tail tube protein [Papillibacter sp.]